jgi:ankyrin repeat protein
MEGYLLEYGTDPDTSDRLPETPLLLASQNGHFDVVQTLLDCGARTHDEAMKAASANGHLKIVKLLLGHHCCTTGAVVAAAQGGYGDIIETLLKRGANANEDDGDLSAICYAMITEHISMFRCLRAQGANPPSPAVREKCLRKAREKGAESMLLLLES